MSKKFKEIKWDKLLYKRAVKDYKLLSVLYADLLLSRETWEGETDMWMNKYYKLLKKYKKLKKKIKEDYSLVASSEVINSSGNSSIEEAVGKETKE